MSKSGSEDELMEDDGSKATNEPLDADTSEDDSESAVSRDVLRLQQAILDDPYNYNSHVQLITLLKKGDDLDKLRDARKKMAKIFPLTPELWLDWIRFEIDLCITDEEKWNIVELFRAAVGDYTSVDLWLEYCQFMIGFMDTPGGTEKVRSVFEQACNKVGVHVTKGMFVFDAYREFEMEIYSKMLATSSYLDSGEDEKNDKLQQQKQKVLSLFTRQLSVPLVGMEKTFESFKAFSGSEPDANLRLLYSKALKKLQFVLPFEEILARNQPKAADYEAYLNVELSDGDPVRIQMLFERAVLDDCLDSALWDKYLKYLDFTLKIDLLALPVHERSVRNCPWVATLWVSYLICLEKLNMSPSKIQSVVDEAFQVNFSTAEDNMSVWMFYISWLRRQISADEPRQELVSRVRNCFQKAHEHLSQFADESCVSHILHYWARFEAKLGNLTEARDVWSLITRQDSASDAQTWVNYATFERIFGDDEHYRKILQKGMFASMDWPETLGNMWIQFEAEEGSLNSLLEAQQKFESRMKVVNEKREKASIREMKQEKNRLSYKNEAKTPFLAKKRKIQVEIASKPEISQPKPRIFMKSDSNCSSTTLLHDQGLVNMEKKKPDADADYGVAPTERDPLKDAQTVFLSNLAYEVEENQIIDAFKSIGDIDELRLVRDYKKRCKGFGYLVFRDIHSVERALKKDRESIAGRPVYVSRFNERKGFTFHAGLEKNKLFVKNISFDATKEELEDLFSECGKITDVRLCTLRNGKFKGMAYVDFLEESAASAAVVRFDGFEFHKKALSVAISNPPVRKSGKVDNTSEAAGATFSKGSTMKHRLFVPRSIQVKSLKESLHTSSVTVDAQAHKMKLQSNEDFRDLLLQK